MDSEHLSLFTDWFGVLAVTHRLSAPDDIRRRMIAEYFDVLRPYPIEAVSSAYETLRRKMKKWPVPADWLEALPPGGSAQRLPLMTAEEQAESDAAERLGYEAETYCHCAICERDSSTHLKPRYVPQLDREGQTIARRHPERGGGRAILLGRWIHGLENKQWHAARGRFFALKTQLDAASKGSPKDRMQRLVAVAGATIAAGPG